MAEIKAVPEPQVDPKAGKPKTKSGTVAPYYDLASCEKVASAIHRDAGGSCERAQLAALLQYSGTKNGAFLTRVASAKAFGLIDQHGELLRITPRGAVIAAPLTSNDAQRARVEAFLNVELFRKVYEEFNGQTLPMIAGLRNLFASKYQLLPDRVDPAIKIMLDSADTAGFFRATNGSRTRMVAPLLAPVSEPANGGAGRVESGATVQEHPEPKQRNGGGGNGGGGEIPPAILGLLTNLPPAGTPMSGKKRGALIAAFTATVGYLYPDKDDED